MKINISSDELVSLVHNQLNSHFLKISSVELDIISASIKNVLVKLEICFSKINIKYYKKNEETFFSPYHSGQYSVFLYFLSKEIFTNHYKSELADKVYYLNKIFNSVDMYYQIDLPSVFYFEHPVSTVLGRACYSDFFVCYQGCTVGGNTKLEYPKLGKYVTLFANATVLGNSIIGNNVFISANTLILNENIPSNSIVFGCSPKLSIVSKSEEYFFSTSPFKIPHN